MQRMLRTFSNFSHARHSTTYCVRPEAEQDLLSFTEMKILARGKGLSYSDCCLNTHGTLVDMQRFNHFISFDARSGIVVCQPQLSFSELFLLHPDYIPPVIPGTIHASLGGGIANDVHGKNNTHAGSLSHHIHWLELIRNQQIIRCSHEQNSSLFYATLGGLGLTGCITRLAVQLKKASRTVAVQTHKINDWSQLLDRMRQATDNDYQVAWLDLLTPNRALLFLANHDSSPTTSPTGSLSVPPLPFRLINRSSMRLFNRFYYQSKKEGAHIQSLMHFNNPLDQLKNWTRLYGTKGLLQFQAVFSSSQAFNILKEVQQLISSAKATPTLCVLKIFSQSGLGLLSFTQPGFTLAIDFINNQQAETAIRALNALMSAQHGKVYLAKDLFLTPEQFQQQYPQAQSMRQQISSAFQSDLSRRIGLSA